MMIIIETRIILIFILPMSIYYIFIDIVWIHSIDEGIIFWRSCGDSEGIDSSRRERHIE
jgi:hypothetical protein